MTKQEQRKTGLSARRALSPEERHAASATIVAHIEAGETFRRAETILSYRAMPDEVDLAALCSTGKRIAYPRCEGKGVMRAYVPADDAWIPGAFGILEPDPAHAVLLEPADIDLVLVPCAAFDTVGGRVGMGGGYYDRYLPLCTRAVKLLVAFDVQRVEKAVMDAFDVRMDMAVTDTLLYCI